MSSCATPVESEERFCGDISAGDRVQIVVIRSLLSNFSLSLIMSVGKADVEDFELILHVINTSNSDAYRSIIPPEQFKDPVLTLKQLQEEFDKMTFYTYRVESKPVGVAALRTDKGKTGIVRWVHVLPEHQHEGVGTSLMKHIEREAKKVGVKKLKVVYVWEKAYWAKNFYIRLGYKKRNSVTLPWGDRAHVYEKTLT